MQSKISLIWSLFIINIGGIALLSMIVFFLPPIAPVLGFYSKPASPAVNGVSQNLTDGGSAEFALSVNFGSQTAPGLPIYLKIPKINVNAVIKQVGLTPNGAMDVPKGPDSVAWLKLGPHPGDNGSAVIAGHYGRWKDGRGSVFDNLNKLKKGDVLSVKDENDMITSFVVREIRKYDPKAYATEVFSSNDGKSHLNLITCGGVWNIFSKSYSQRLVVFTDKEEIKSYLLAEHFER